MWQFLFNFVCNIVCLMRCVDPVKVIFEPSVTQSWSFALTAANVDVYLREMSLFFISNVCIHTKDIYFCVGGETL